jgi:predicted XRE-type DNA-binding protein
MRRGKQSDRIKMVRGSGNVYADLGFKDADQLLVKAELVAAISSIISRRGLKQADAAEVLGLTQPKLSRLLRGDFHGFSERRLIDCLTSLGRDVQIVVKEKPRSRTAGRLSVVVMQAKEIR